MLWETTLRRLGRVCSASRSWSPTHGLASRPRRGRSGILVVFVAAIAMLGFVDSARAQAWVVQMRSGQVGGAPGAPGQLDTNVWRHPTTAPAGPLSATPFGPAWFAGAQPLGGGVQATLTQPNPGWLAPSFFCDPQLARWISHTFPSVQNGASALYAIPFNVDVVCIGRAELDLCWVADEYLGDGALGPNPSGVYLNGTPLPIQGGSFATISQANSVPLPIGAAGGLVPGQNWLYIYTRNVGVADSGLMFEAEVRVWDCPTCAEPPRDMVLWMPFDEAGGPTTRNILLNPSGNGTLGQAAGLGGTGRVGGAICFDQGHVNVAHYPALTLDGDLSIDAWVDLWGFTIPREHTIVDKRQFSPLFPGGWRGYRLYIDTPAIPALTGTLMLEFQDDVSGALQLASGPAVNIGGWQHIAVLVDRHAAGAGSIDVSFAVNGVCTPATGLSGAPVTGTLGTPVTRIGDILGPPAINQWLGGCLDELEIFDRALDCAEVDAIFQAGATGKCREFCSVEWDRSFYGTQSSIQVPARLCNNTVGTQVYNITINPLACPFGSTPSPVGITTNPVSPIAVPPGGCSTVWLTIPRPAFTAIGDVSCYEICMTNTATGDTHCCQGSVQWSPFVVVGPTASNPGSLSTGGTFQLGFPVQNPGGATTIAYRVSAIGPDMMPDARSISLDEQEPGTDIAGLLDLPAGAETSVEFTARFVRNDPMKWYAILLEMDLDGDGSFEPMESISVMNGLEDPCPPTIVEDFEFYTPGGEPCGIGGWGPWPGSTDVCGMVTTDEAFSGMRSLKIDGAMGGATGLGDDMVQRFDLTSGRHVLTMQTLVPMGASGRGWVVMLSEFPAPFNWALNLMLDADAGVIRDEQDAGQSTPLVFDAWAELQVVIDLDADTVDATYNGVQFITGKSWTLGVPPSGPATFKALDLYADEPASAGGRGTSGMYFDDVVLRTLCEPVAEPCVADCDRSGALDLFDFLCFQNAFAAGDASADLDGDGQLTLFDFLAFQNAFAAGCP